MDTNPFLELGSNNAAPTQPVKQRSPRLAALLALLGGPLGHIYAGCFTRGLLIWTMGIILVVLIFLFIHFMPGPIGVTLAVAFLVGYEFFLVIDAYRMAKLRSGLPLRPYQRWWFYLLAWVVISLMGNAAGYAVQNYVAEAFVIPARSMSPTLLPGDRILSDKFWCQLSNLHHNDVVVFRSAGLNSPLYAMRVVALPGDNLEIRDEKVWLNGEEWPDPHGYFDPKLTPNPEQANFGPITMSDDSFFVLGDNRRQAHDSRFLGPIPFSSFHSRAMMIYLSVERRFPNPHDTTHYESGEIRWSRIGQKIE